MNDSGGSHRNTGGDRADGGVVVVRDINISGAANQGWALAILYLTLLDEIIRRLDDAIGVQVEVFADNDGFAGGQSVDLQGDETGVRVAGAGRRDVERHGLGADAGAKQGREDNEAAGRVEKHSVHTVVFGCDSASEQAQWSTSSG